MKLIKIATCSLLSFACTASNLVAVNPKLFIKRASAIDASEDELRNLATQLNFYQLKTVLKAHNKLTVTGRAIINDELMRQHKKQVQKRLNSVIVEHKRSSKNSISSCVTNGANLDFPDINGMTPLMLAAHIGDIQAVLELLGSGANAALQDNTGKTAYAYAQANGHSDICKILALQNNKAADDNQIVLSTNRFATLDSNLDDILDTE